MSDTPRHGSLAWPQATFDDDELRNGLDTLTALEIGEDERPRLPHPQGVRLHHREVGSDKRRQVNLDDHEQIGPRDSWSAFARNLLSLRDIDHIDREVC